MNDQDQSKHLAEIKWLLIVILVCFSIVCVGALLGLRSLNQTIRDAEKTGQWLQSPAVGTAPA